MAASGFGGAIEAVENTIPDNMPTVKKDVVFKILQFEGGGSFLEGKLRSEVKAEEYEEEIKSSGVSHVGEACFTCSQKYSIFVIMFV